MNHAQVPIGILVAVALHMGGKMMALQEGEAHLVMVPMRFVARTFDYISFTTLQPVASDRSFYQFLMTY